MCQQLVHLPPPFFLLLPPHARQVSIFDVNDAKMAEAKAEFGDAVTTFKVDVSDEAMVKAGIDHTIATFGKLDILINCAGIVGPNGIKTKDVKGEDFDRVIAINLRGSFNVTKNALPHMEANNYGRILLIASIAGKDGNAVGKAAKKKEEKEMEKEEEEANILRTLFVDLLFFCFFFRACARTQRARLVSLAL